MKQTRLAIIETFRVQGFREMEKLVVEVVAKLVEHGPQETAKRDDFLVFCCTHPDLESGDLAVFLGQIQAM